MCTTIEGTDESMTKSIPGVDKNLQNVVNELETPDLLAHANQQTNQKHNDLRERDLQHYAKKFYETENQE